MRFHTTSARLRQHAAHALLLLSSVALLACASDSAPSDTPAPQTASDSQAAHVASVVAGGGVVDSILPIAEHLRRFRASLPVSPDTLRHASPSTGALVDRWAKAIATHDTADLNRMVLDRAEFAWLYYPDSRMSKPPYEAPPELLWGQILASSDEGARRALQLHGGVAVDARALQCPDAVETEGKNRVRQNCTVRLRIGARSLPASRYFGSIIEREGRFKFISLANSL